jgi:hypothetical protein
MEAIVAAIGDEYAQRHASPPWLLLGPIRSLVGVTRRTSFQEINVTAKSDSMRERQ